MNDDAPPEGLRHGADLAREAMDLPPFRRLPIAIIGEMRQGPVRAALREVVVGVKCGLPEAVIAFRVKRMIEGSQL